MGDQRKNLIVLLASQETSPAVLYGLYEVLSSVGAAFPVMTMGEPGPEALNVRIVSHDGEVFQCLGDMLMKPHAAIDQIEQADVVIVCDMYTSIHHPPRGRYPREIAWLQKMHAAGVLICSVCSGSLVLAEAGLLDGLEATSHWGYDDLFRRCYPAVKYHKDMALCLSGEPKGIITAGAATSWQDLVIYLIARFCGQQQALHTAKVFMLTGHDDGQLPFAAMTKRLETSDSLITDCQNWIAENYAIANPVQRMINRSNLSPRTFSRRFRSATGYQPLDYVQTLRIEEAKQMLETGEQGIEEITEVVGYDDSASFRRLFKRKAGLTPTAYRRKYASLVFRVSLE